VTVAQLVFVFANAIDEQRLFVEVETAIARSVRVGPPDGTEAVRGLDLIDDLAVFFNQGNQGIQVGLVG